MADGGYPFDDQKKLFEQTGWLKAEIDQIKTSQITEADLLKFEKRIVTSFQESLNSWWEHKPRELDAQIDRRIVADKEARIKARQEALAESGLEVDENGKAKPKGGWAKSVLSQSSLNTVLILIGIALAIPETRGIILRLFLFIF